MVKAGYDALMDDVCVDLGFCGCIKEGEALHVDLFIPSSGPVKVDQFVDWVFLADNVNPNTNLEKWQPLKDAIRAAFIKRMGAEVVDAAQLRWSHAPAPFPVDPDSKRRGKLLIPD